MLKPDYPHPLLSLHQTANALRTSSAETVALQRHFVLAVADAVANLDAAFLAHDAESTDVRADLSERLHGLRQTLKAIAAKAQGENATGARMIALRALEDEGLREESMRLEFGYGSDECRRYEAALRVEDVDLPLPVGALREDRLGNRYRVVESGGDMVRLERLGPACVDYDGSEVLSCTMAVAIET